MSDLNENYLARAAEARASADQNPLLNVRQKHLASAAAWERLAHTASKMAELRARRLVERPAVAAGSAMTG